MSLIGNLLSWALSICVWLLVLRAIVSWVPMLVPSFRPQGALAGAFGLIYRVTEPPLRWLRRFIPSPRIGAASLDLSFMVWFVVLLLAQRMVVVIFF